MKIFVTGATGVLGRRVVPLLVGAGHSVTGVSRSAAKAEELRAAGATPVTVDLFDPAAVRAAVAGHDAVCNLATHIPPLSRAALPSSWAENNRIRTEASANLVDAALAEGVTRFVQEALAFVYADGGDAWLDESAPLALGAPTESTRAAEAAVARFSAGGGTGVVLRFGYFYGPDAAHTQAQLKAARQGVSAFPGPPGAYQPQIHLDDAASAVVAALDAQAGVYNIVEDRPGTRAEIAQAVATAMGVAPLWLPPSAARVPGMSYLTSSQRVSNRAFRTATGWAPRYPSPAEGWAAVVSAAGMGPTSSSTGERRRKLAVRWALALLVLSDAPLALWATFAPRSFFDNFPGSGHRWVAVDGPYNHHLVGDVGAFSLALLVVTVVALCSRSRLMIRTAGVAWVVSALPHFLYHLGHQGTLSAGDQAASLAGLAFEVVLGAACVVLAPPSRAQLTPTTVAVEARSEPSASLAS